MTDKTLIYNSRTYNIIVVEHRDGTAYAEVRTKHLYKHRVYRWRRTHRKLRGSMFKWFEPSHCLIDYAKDYIDYDDCLQKLRYSKCARKWFINITKPYVDKFL